MQSALFAIPSSLVVRCYENGADLPDYRTEFMRDRDRVMYCTAFRRLSGKTQIYTIGSDDHKKNRLTHSLEVSQIARTISHALGLNCDLAEAMALAHDFGHTPFGHAGERMLHEIMIPESTCIKESPFYNCKQKNILDTINREQSKMCNGVTADNMFGFKHNIQSVRVACVLEDSYRSKDNKNIGLNLTNYTLWGMMNHSSLRYDSDSLFPNYQNGFAKQIQVNGSSSEAWSFEAYIVRLADDIAQWHHDLEDAIRGEAIPIATLCETIVEALGNRMSEEDDSCINEIKKTKRVDRKIIANISHIVVNTLVNDVVETSKKNLSELEKHLKEKYKNQDDRDVAAIVYSDYDSVGFNGKQDTIISLSDSIKVSQFKETIKEMVHHSRDVERMNEKGKYIIRKLFEAYYSHPQQLPDGPIFHFMVDIGQWDNIDAARDEGAGKVRTDFEKVLTNPTVIVKSVLMRRICDHIASMTDHYAIEEYNSLYG